MPTSRQGTDVSKTEVHSTRELANKYVRIVQYTIVQYNTLQYIKLRYSIEAPNKYLYCTVLFRTVLYKKEKICPQTKNKERKKERTFRKLKSTLRGSWPTRKDKKQVLYSIKRHLVVDTRRWIRFLTTWTKLCSGVVIWDSHHIMKRLIKKQAIFNCF